MAKKKDLTPAEAAEAAADAELAEAVAAEPTADLPVFAPVMWKGPPGYGITLRDGVDVRFDAAGRVVATTIELHALLSEYQAKADGNAYAYAQIAPEF